jgi:hypothetical protein
MHDISQATIREGNSVKGEAVAVKLNQCTGQCSATLGKAHPREKALCTQVCVQVQQDVKTI